MPSIFTMSPTDMSLSWKDGTPGYGFVVKQYGTRLRRSIETSDFQYMGKSISLQ